jgi:putative membrane protein
MNNTFDFSKFSHQSKKGILVIYVNLLYKFFRISWVLLFLIFKDFSEFTDQKLNYIYLGVGFVFIFILVRAYLLFKNFQFKIENNHFVLKQGILKKTNTSISFDRIQNINFKQNIIQQIIDVHEVNIETAGSNKTEISIKALY